MRAPITCSNAAASVVLASRTSSSSGPQICDSAWLSLVLMSNRDLYGAWSAPCNPRTELKFAAGRHVASQAGDFDAVIRQDPVRADLDDDGQVDLVAILTCVPRGQDATTGFSSVEAFLWDDDGIPRQLGEPLLLTPSSCSEVLTELGAEDASVKVTIREESEDGCAGEPGDDREVELALRGGEPVRLDPLSANTLDCEGQEGLAAAGNLVLSTRPHGGAVLAQFPRDAQVAESSVRAEQLYVTRDEDDRARAEAGWRLVEVTEDGDLLGCAWIPPATG